MSLSTDDLVGALVDLHDRFGCELTTATMRLTDDVRLTISLDGASNLTITRDAGKDDDLRRFTVKLRERQGRHP